MTPRKIGERLIGLGFRVAAVAGNSKIIITDDFPNRATGDHAEWASWSEDDVLGFPHHINVGISTTRFGENEALIALDVDDKNGKNGSEELQKLEMLGHDLPETYTQFTPTGGRHIVYRHAHAVKQGVDVLGRGLDIRSHGGYIVASGSTIDGKAYTDNGLPVAPAPTWLVEKCGKVVERAPETGAPAAVDEDRARVRFDAYLLTAPRSTKGDGGDATAYAVACAGRDYGVSEAECLDAMLSEAWDDGCGWTADKLAVKVKNAYRYANAPAGNRAPEVEFQPVNVPVDPPKSKAPVSAPADKTPVSATADNLEPPEPTDEAARKVNGFNKQFAFVLIGGDHYVLWERLDHKGRFELRYLAEAAFMKRHSGITVQVDKKWHAAAKLWFDAPGRVSPPENPNSFWRRSFDGICFTPERTPPDGYYNTWRGFACKPYAKFDDATDGQKWALQAWLEHSLRNVCGDNEALHRWHVGWYAHLVQRPWEKPLVGLVYRGQKGTGKNSIVQRVRDLLGPHGLVTHERRYLLGQFNGHMESLILFCLDEALWAGDKAGEGVLKGIVTGDEHLIERKGKETYTVDNLTRIVIIGNEEWIVPATHDERRYAVFNVGIGRQKDKAFFKRMKDEMNGGGNRLLLHYLLHVDISGLDINEAPGTQGLLDQKMESLDPLAQWWYESLVDGRIAQSDTPSTEWAVEIPVDEIPHSLSRYFRARNIGGRVPASVVIGRTLRKFCPGIERERRPNNGYVYKIPELPVCREQWEAHMGHSISWT